MNVLVMGGTRLLGRETVFELARRGHHVTVFNRGTREVEWGRPVQEIRGDRDVSGDVAALRDLPTDAVIDFSAYTRRQTELLLDVLGRVPRFVHCSSGAIYQPDPVMPWSEGSTPLGPWPLWGSYGQEKLWCEGLLRERRASHATTALRPPMVLGPGNYVHREEWVLNRLLDGAEIAIPGDGRAVIHFVSARQVAQAAVNAAERFAGGGFRALNIAEPSAVTSALGFVELCGAVVGCSPRIRHVAPTGPVFDVTDNSFPFPSENYLLDTRSAVDAGIQPTPVRLEEMIQEAYEHLLRHPERRAWARGRAEIAALEAA